MRETGFAAVLRRELRRMVSRRLYFGVCVALPLFCILFMATIFGSGPMERIPVGVVDLDWTASSRSVTRTVEAVPTFRVSGHYADEQSARTATQRKEIYGYLVIPPRFETDLRGGRGATLRYYYHYALLSVGSEVRGAFETVLRPLAMTPVVTEAVALGVSERTAESFLVPVSSQSHPLYNPDLDYSVYLSQPFFFILFQVIVLLVTVYAVGSEIKFRTGDDWLRTAGMNVFSAVAGKLLPYDFCSDKRAGQLRAVRRDAHPVLVRVLAAESDLGPVRRGYAMLGRVPVLAFPGYRDRHQRGVDGRLARRHALGRNFPGSFHVRAGLLRFVPVSGPPFRRDQSEPALRRLRVRLYVAERSRTAAVRAAGAAGTASLEKSRFKPSL